MRNPKEENIEQTSLKSHHIGCQKAVTCERKPIDALILK
jgi:hypothetical protein